MNCRETGFGPVFRFNVAREETVARGCGKARLVEGPNGAPFAFPEPTKKQVPTPKEKDEPMWGLAPK